MLHRYSNRYTYSDMPTAIPIATPTGVLTAIPIATPTGVLTAIPTEQI